MPTQGEALARYAVRASFTDVSAESRRQLPIHILDSLACSIAALGAGPVEACRAQVAEFGGTGPGTLIGGDKQTLSTQRSGTPHSCATSISWTTSLHEPKPA